MDGDVHCIVNFDAVGVTVCCVEGCSPDPLIDTKGCDLLHERQVPLLWARQEPLPFAMPSDSPVVNTGKQGKFHVPTITPL